MLKSKKLFFILLLILSVCIASIPTYASEKTTSPRYTTLTDCSFSFLASNGIGYATVIYNSSQSTFTKATVNIKVQKRLLLVFWTDVDEWTTSSNQPNGNFYNNFTLKDSGTYRATFTLTITSANGLEDVVTQTIESAY